MADAEEPQVKTIEEYHEQTSRRWPALVAYLIIALVIAALLVFGARAIYRHYHKPTIKTVPVSTKVLPKQPSANGASSSSNASSASNTSSSSSTAAGQTSNLPNSGPGQVVGLFVTASLVAAGLHYIYRLRQANN